jgi:hypothetical protein
MRTTFFEMCLLNYTSQMHHTYIFYTEIRKEWEESKIEGERERERIGK